MSSDVEVVIYSLDVMRDNPGYCHSPKRILLLGGFRRLDRNLTGVAIRQEENAIVDSQRNGPRSMGAPGIAHH